VCLADVTVAEDIKTINVVEVGDFFDRGSSSAFDYFKVLLMCNDINEVIWVYSQFSSTTLVEQVGE